MKFFIYFCFFFVFPKAQPQATPSPAAGLFQFGSPNSSTPQPSEQPKPGGFNFSLGAPPTFNFSEQNTQQVTEINKIGTINVFDEFI